DRGLATARLRAVAAGLDPRQPHRPARARILRRRSRVVRGQPASERVGDAGVEGAVGAGEEVAEPSRGADPHAPSILAPRAPPTSKPGAPAASATIPHCG